MGRNWTGEKTVGENLGRLICHLLGVDVLLQAIDIEVGVVQRETSNDCLSFVLPPTVRL